MVSMPNIKTKPQPNNWNQHLHHYHSSVIIKHAINLFDGRAQVVVWICGEVSIRVLTTLTGVTSTTDSIHGNRQSGVCFVRNTSETHSA